MHGFHFGNFANGSAYVSKVRCGIAVIAMSVAALQSVGAQVFRGFGPTAADIQTSVNSFRTTLGTLNPNVAGSFGSGRREINWDGVPDALAAPSNLPANFFNVNSPRGVVFSTPGTGFMVSANAGVAPIDFGNINAAYTSMFQPFSAQRLFTALGSTITDVNFFVPGSGAAGSTNGFGVVFSDVDSPSSTSIEYFDVFGASLGTFFADAVTGDETFSFLGVIFTNGSRVGRVRITSGNQILSAAPPTGDAVVMDDFIYGEPLAVTAVPEPATWLLLSLGLGGMVLVMRRRRV